MKVETRICGNCGQHNRVVHTDQKCSGCGKVAFDMLDPDEGVAKHMIPRRFFDRGEYEVWAAKSYDGGAPIVLIAGGLTLETAKSFNWPRKEIRLRGSVVDPEPLSTNPWGKHILAHQNYENKWRS